MLIIYNKNTKQAYEVPDDSRASDYTSADISDIRWQIKRTGRYDDEHYVIIPLNQEPEA